MSLVNSIAGKLISKTPTLANVEIGGFVFNVKISLASFEKLPKINENITLLTHLHVKEDILELYGFVYETERSLFLNLNKINGIGPRSAMNILSGTSPAEFKQKIIEGDVKSLTSIPGIGAKTAKRIIIELKEVFSHDLDTSEEIGFDDKKETSFARDATSALKSLGYKENQISKAISELQRRSGIPDKLEDVIREILKELN
ncbi:MAG: Holliday junction branch migration protein RuvA [Candidatus Neomarinimicrobiota bacterium]